MLVSFEGFNELERRKRGRRRTRQDSGVRFAQVRTGRVREESFEHRRPSTDQRRQDGSASNERPGASRRTRPSTRRRLIERRGAQVQKRTSGRRFRCASNLPPPSRPPPQPQSTRLFYIMLKFAHKNARPTIDECRPDRSPHFGPGE